MTDRMIDNLRMYFPHIAMSMESYRQYDDFELLIRLNDGSTILYDDVEKAIRTLPKDKSTMSEEECRSEFGYRLRKLLRRNKMTQTELAEASGVSKPMLSYYINGTVSPSFYNVDRIARALGCSIDELRYMG